MIRQPSVINILNKMNNNKIKHGVAVADDEYWGEGRHYFPYTFEYDPKKKMTFTPVPIPVPEIEEKIEKMFNDFCSVWGKDKIAFRKTSTKHGVEFIIRITDHANAFVDFGKLRRKK